MTHCSYLLFYLTLCWMCFEQKTIKMLFIWTSWHWSSVFYVLEQSVFFIRNDILSLKIRQYGRHLFLCYVNKWKKLYTGLIPGPPNIPKSTYTQVPMWALWNPRGGNVSPPWGLHPNHTIVNLCLDWPPSVIAPMQFKPVLKCQLHSWVTPLLLYVSPFCVLICGLVACVYSSCLSFGEAETRKVMNYTWGCRRLVSFWVGEK